jgi:hypothetical protein
MAHRKWTDETIAATLAPIVAELGRMPSRTELAERDLAALWSAMRRNGGTRVWAQRAGALAGVAPEEAPGPAQAPVPEEAPAPPTREERIRLRAYFLAIDGAPGGPEEHWLRAERELAA